MNKFIIFHGYANNEERLIQISLITSVDITRNAEGRKICHIYTVDGRVHHVDESVDDIQRLLGVDVECNNFGFPNEGNGINELDNDWKWK